MYIKHGIRLERHRYAKFWMSADIRHVRALWLKYQIVNPTTVPWWCPNSTVCFYLLDRTKWWCFSVQYESDLGWSHLVEESYLQNVGFDVYDGTTFKTTVVVDIIVSRKCCIVGWHFNWWGWILLCDRGGA